MKPNHFLLVLAVGLLALGAASVGPWAPSPFTARTGTNTTAAAWRTAIGASATTSGSLTNMAMVGGSETGVTNSDLTASRVVVSSSAKVLSSSSATATEAGYLSGVTSAIQTQLDSKPTVALTNLMLLSANNAPTGTNTLSIASLRASGAVSVVLLATNLNWLGDVTGPASNPSPWSDVAQVASFTMPAVPGNNGVMRFTLLRELSNAVSAAIYPVFYGGASDGFLGAGAAVGAAAATNYNSAQIVFANNGSSTNQIVNAGGSQSASWTTASGVLDTSTNWTLRLGLSHSSTGVTSTNIGLKTLIVEWVFGP